MLHGGSLVAGDAGVVAIVQQREVGDAQRAGEVNVVNGDPQAGRNWPTILLPGDEDRLVPRHDHARDEDSLAHRKPREFEWVDSRRDWMEDRRMYWEMMADVSRLLSRFPPACRPGSGFSRLTLC